MSFHCPTRGPLRARGAAPAGLPLTGWIWRGFGTGNPEGCEPRGRPLLLTSKLTVTYRLSRPTAAVTQTGGPLRTGVAHSSEDSRRTRGCAPSSGFHLATWCGAVGARRRTDSHQGAAERLPGLLHQVAFSPLGHESSAPLQPVPTWSVGSRARVGPPRDAVGCHLRAGEPRAQQASRPRGNLCDNLDRGLGADALDNSVDIETSVAPEASYFIIIIAYRLCGDLVLPRGFGAISKQMRLDST